MKSICVCAYMYVYTYTYIYIYIYRERERGRERFVTGVWRSTAHEHDMHFGRSSPVAAVPSSRSTYMGIRLQVYQL